MPLSAICWVYERNFYMVIKSKLLAVERQVLCTILSKTEHVESIKNRLNRVF